METPYDGGTKVCSNGPGHITKMAIVLFGLTYQVRIMTWPQQFSKNKLLNMVKTLQKSSSPEPED